jgi:hypothetical protein
MKAIFECLAPHVRRGCTAPDHSDKEWDRVVDSQGHRCFYCANLVTVGAMTKDHLHPICTGGCSCVGNLVGACRTCNSMKRARTVTEFLRMRPSFLRTMGEFSTRILVLNREAFFWEKLRPQIAQIAAAKRMPNPALVLRRQA